MADRIWSEDGLTGSATGANTPQGEAMTEQKLKGREQVFIDKLTNYLIYWEEVDHNEKRPTRSRCLIQARQILDFVKEAGYKSSEEVEQIVQNWKDAYAFPEKWMKANGYVKLTDKEDRERIIEAVARELFYTDWEHEHILSLVDTGYWEDCPDDIKQTYLEQAREIRRLLP